MNGKLKICITCGALFSVITSSSSQLWQTICNKCKSIEEPHNTERSETFVISGVPIAMLSTSASGISTTGYLNLINNRS